MKSQVTYRVHVTHEDGQWLADVPQLEGAHTYARSLAALDRYIREVIVLAADLPDDAMDSLDLDYTYNVADPLIADAVRAHHERAELHDRE
ncbi:hypothetical protein ACFV9C_41765 [Kribbella sp. NPDC059898]|uniref:hypothetical protein n=1 Tax=Kribbella sp. NPDC059898 TaxID=3346995 RepID=UPI0036604E44